MDTRFPVYVLSKGRPDTATTPRLLAADGVPHVIVAEPAEADAYAASFPHATVLILPSNDHPDGAARVRNWIWRHAAEAGALYHWQLDDDLLRFLTWDGPKKTASTASVVLRAVEDFAAAYRNLGACGPNLGLWLWNNRRHPAFVRNRQVPSCVLLRTDLPYRFRPRLPEDTDLALQILSSGVWCTALLNSHLFDKAPDDQGAAAGGAAALYAGGRIRGIRELQRRWPGLVEPYIAPNGVRAKTSHLWRHFSQPLLPAADHQSGTVNHEHAHA